MEDSPNNIESEPKPLSKEVAFAMLDVIETINQDLLRKAEEVASSRPDILADREIYHKYIVAAAKLDGNAEAIELLRKYISSQFGETSQDTQS